MGAGTISEFRDIGSLSTDELLEGFAARTTPELGPVETWITTQGYYPGETKIGALELYHRYRDWHREQPDYLGQKAVSSKVFGLIAGSRFRKGKAKSGFIYYISRTPKIDVGAIPGPK